MKDEYLSREHSSLAQDKAIQICCLALRHYFINLQDAALDKKSNFDYIEKEIGLHKFLPAPVLSSTKRKALRKIIQSNFKKYVSLSDKECMIQFLEAVRLVLRYDQEKFRCALGVSNFFLLLHCSFDLVGSTLFYCMVFWVHGNCAGLINIIMENLIPFVMTWHMVDTQHDKMYRSLL